MPTDLIVECKSKTVTEGVTGGDTRATIKVSPPPRAMRLGVSIRRLTGASSRPAEPGDLRKFALFAPLGEERFADIVEQGEVRSFKAGEILPSVELVEHCVFFVLAGSFHISRMTPSGRYVSIGNAGEGEHFGEIPMFSSEVRRSFYVHCDHAGACFLLPESRLRWLLSESPEMTEILMRSMARDAMTRGDRIFEFATLDLKYRLLAEIVRLARYGVVHDGEIVLKLAPTHEALAAQVGSSREGVTRLMQDFVRQNLVRVPRRGAIAIPDIDRLREMVDRKTGLQPADDAA